MLKNKITAAFLGLALCLPVVLISAPTAQAQDIRIYTPGTGNVPTSNKPPLVVLTLDLSILQLTDKLPVVGGVLGDLGGPLSGVTDALHKLDITSDQGLLARLDILRLLLYQVLKQLVGLRVAIVVPYGVEDSLDVRQLAARKGTTPNEILANRGYSLDGVVDTLGLAGCELAERLGDSCGLVGGILGGLGDLLNAHQLSELNLKGLDLSGFPNKEVITERSAAIIFSTGNSAILGTQLDDRVKNVVNLVNNVVEGVGEYQNLTFAVDFRAVDVYNELVNYLDGGTKPSSTTLTAANVLDGNGEYISPLQNCANTTVHVINVLLSQPVDSTTFASKTDGAGANDFDYGKLYSLTSSYLVAGPEGGGVLNIVQNALGSATTLIGSTTGLSFLAGGTVRATAIRENLDISGSLSGAQVVQNRLAGGSRPLYAGGFFYQSSNKTRIWAGSLEKLTLADSDNSPGVDKVEQASGAFTWPGTVKPANDDCSNNSTFPCVYYEDSTHKVANLDLAKVTIKDLATLPGNSTLEAAKQVAWARGYQTRYNRLGEDGYKGLLGFLTSTVGFLTGTLENVLNAVIGFVLPGACSATNGCQHKFLGICYDSAEDWLNSVTDALQDLLGAVGGLLGLDLATCSVPQKNAFAKTRDGMGDILHSDPLAIDYGTPENPDIRIFFGTNTGFLHQFSEDTGYEVWRFAPRATLQHFGEWRTESYQNPHGPYGVDGAPIAYIKNTGDTAIKASEGDKVYLYFGLRRGGKRYYALDVTNPDQKPILVWTINSKDVPGNKFSNLGWTFSMPAIGKAYGDDREKHVVLIFGGGYDKGNDPPAAVGNYPDVDCDTVGSGGGCTDDANDEVGTALYVVNALSGKLIHKFTGGSDYSIKDSIPSAPTAVDTNGDSLLDYVYVGDTGGRAWRADISADNPDNWRMKLIAELGRHDKSKMSDDRRFFHPPDVVRVSNGDYTFRLVVIASGNRAAPLKTQTQNYLYVLIDSKGTEFPIKPDNSLASEELIESKDLLTNVNGKNCSPSCSMLDPKFPHAGWKLKLDTPGEKALSSPITLNGTIVLTTYVPPDPSPNACTPQEGTGKLYAVQLTTGGQAKWSSVSKDIIDPRGIPSTLQYIGSGRFLARGDTGDDDNNNFTVLNVGSQRVWRTYWRTRKSAHW